MGTLWQVEKKEEGADLIRPLFFQNLSRPKVFAVCRTYSSFIVRGITPGIHHFSQLSSTLSWKYWVSSGVK